MDKNATKQRLSSLISGIKGDRSTRQFALDLGVALGTVQNWLDGSGLPSLENLEPIATAAGVTVEELTTKLLYGEDKKTSPSPRKAEDVFQLALQLDDEERRRLIKMLADAIGR